MFGPGSSSVTLEDILSQVTEFNIVSYYLGVNELPCIMNSPLRQDRKPSFGVYSLDGNKVSYIDFSTKDRGGLFDLLKNWWSVSFREAICRVYNDIPKFNGSCKVRISNIKSIREYAKDTDLQCKVREWRDYDIRYWESFGITLDWLKYADIYPISYKIVIKGDQRYVFSADKYAYAYVERKEGKVTLKIYQPFNTKYKWSNKHDSSVISLWTKVPENGDRIIICSSMKDALCVWNNTGIPCIAIQGEGYSMSDTAVNELKRRYKEVYILLDNDEAGLKDGIKLAEETGFTNLILPDYGAKDCSDLFKLLKDKDKFREIIEGLLKH